MRFHSILCAALLVSFGCASPQHRAVERINTRCPIMPDLDIDGATFVEWNGIRVGFCCAECIERWDRMNDEMKRAAIERAAQSAQGL
jgi:hypothetical protein